MCVCACEGVSISFTHLASSSSFPSSASPPTPPLPPQPPHTSPVLPSWAETFAAQMDEGDEEECIAESSSRCLWTVEKIFSCKQLMGWGGRFSRELCCVCGWMPVVVVRWWRGALLPRGTGHPVALTFTQSSLMRVATRLAGG